MSQQGNYRLAKLVWPQEKLLVQLFTIYNYNEMN